MEGSSDPRKLVDPQRETGCSVKDTFLTLASTNERPPRLDIISHTVELFLYRVGEPPCVAQKPKGGTRDPPTPGKPARHR